jgi:hypothetical protein
MDPTDLTDLGSVASDGADLAVNAPDIQTYVAPSSFDLTNNYTQSLVDTTYNPGGVPINAFGTDATVCTLANQATLPTGTEDAVAYSTNLDVTPPYQDTVAATDFTNTTDGGPVDANSAGSQATNATDNLQNPSLHGIQDAITGLIQIGGALGRASTATVANRNSIAQRTPAPSLTTQQMGGAPMTAGRSVANGTPSQINPNGKPSMSAATIAILVGGVGFLALGMIG